LDQREVTWSTGEVSLEPETMPPSPEVKLEHFFASRSGVCVYVAVGKRSYRVQFADATSQGVVVEGGQDGAEAARRIARRALLEHREGLMPLFEKVARSLT
jgi:hypothetical protein